MEFNRGDRKTIKLTKADGVFSVGDKIKFSIMDKDDYDKVYFQKTFVVTAQNASYELVLEPNDTRFGENVKTKYAYEIELNDNQTVLGDNEGKTNILTLYREAGDKE